MSSSRNCHILLSGNFQGNELRCVSKATSNNFFCVNLMDVSFPSIFPLHFSPICFPSLPYRSPPFPYPSLPFHCFPYHLLPFSSYPLLFPSIAFPFSVFANLNLPYLVFLSLLFPDFPLLSLPFRVILRSLIFATVISPVFAPPIPLTLGIYKFGHKNAEMLLQNF